MRFLLAVFLVFSAGVSAPQSDRPEVRPDAVIADSSAEFEKMQALELPEMSRDSMSPIFNECHYCQKGNRLWYSSIEELCRQTIRCNFDFLEVRTDQLFVGKEATVFVMVYCSADTNFLSVDSLIYVERSKSASIRKTVSIVQSGNGIPEKERAGFLFQNPSDRNCGRLRRIAERCKDFCSAAKYDGKTKRFAYSFTLNGRFYAVKDDKFTSSVSDHAPIRGTDCSNARTYYRIGISDSNERSDCAEVINKQEGQSDIELAVKDHYAFNQCIVDFEAASSNGIQSISLTADKFAGKEIKFSGDKKVTGSVPVGCGKEKSVLFVKATDTRGMSVEKRLVIFEKIDKKNKEIEAAGKLSKSRESWARKNAWNSTVDFLARWQGEGASGLISALLNAYCDGKAQELLLRIPDAAPRDGMRQFNVPLKGRAPFSEKEGNDTVSLYSSSWTIHAKDFTTSGTRLAELIAPSLNSSGKEASIDFRYEFPVGKGYYTPRFAVSPRQPSSDRSSAAFILCSKAVKESGDIALTDIPYILDNPQSNIDFALAAHLQNSGEDSLVISYLIEYLDRSKQSLFRIFSLRDSAAHKDRIHDDGAALAFESEIVPLDSNERCVISRERLETDKKILALYVFAYAPKSASTVGAAAIWTRY